MARKYLISAESPGVLITDYMALTKLTGVLFDGLKENYIFK